jgi:hypothetical protein
MLRHTYIVCLVIHCHYVPFSVPGVKLKLLLWVKKTISDRQGLALKVIQQQFKWKELLGYKTIDCQSPVRVVVTEDQLLSTYSTTPDIYLTLRQELFMSFSNL